MSSEQEVWRTNRRQQAGVDARRGNESLDAVGELIEPRADGLYGQYVLPRHFSGSLAFLSALPRRYGMAYRSVSANFAPSATKAAAKVRRIQLMTRGLEITLSRIAAANMP